jgi:peptidoglycan/LPS O-acetylase OafA/YrhL
LASDRRQTFLRLWISVAARVVKLAPALFMCVREGEGAGKVTVAEQKDNPNLDLLRAVAVLMVLVFHLLLYHGTVGVGSLSLKMLGLGGVLFFFVHTSLVLMFSLERLQRKLSGTRLYIGFILRRCFRIYPLSILVVALIAAFRLPMGHLAPGSFDWVPVSRLGFVSNVLLTQNLTNTQSVLGPLWSLPFEMQMYVFLPFLFVFARRIRSVGLLLLIWVAAVVVGLFHAHFGHLPDLVRYVPCFLPGVIAYKAGEKPLFRLPFALWPTFLAMVGLLLLWMPRIEMGWAVCLLIGLAIPQFAILSNTWLRKAAHWVAKYSYGIYLGHYFCLWIAFVKLGHMPWVIRWLVCFALLAAIPVGLYHLLEEPMIVQGGRFVDALFKKRRSAVAIRTLGSKVNAPDFGASS